MARVISGTVTVTLAGTQVAFPEARGRIVWLKVRAKEGNTGIVYLGDADVSASSGYPLHNGTDGVHSEVELSAPFGGSIQIDAIYLDSASNGDAADFIAVVEN